MCYVIINIFEDPILIHMQYALCIQNNKRDKWKKTFFHFCNTGCPVLKVLPCTVPDFWDQSVDVVADVDREIAESSPEALYSTLLS